MKSRNNILRKVESHLGVDGFLLPALLISVASFAFFGGADPQVNLNILIIFVSSLSLILAVTKKNGYAVFAELPWYARLVVVAPIALPLFQLIPLPPLIWHALAGQELRFQVLELIAEGNSWQPISLAPNETAYSAAIGIWVSTLFLALLMISRKALDYVIITLLSITLIGCLIGAFQFSGAFAALKFYKDAHQNTLIGFFANKNHMALTIAVSVLFSKYLSIRFTHSGFRYVHYSIVVFFIFAALATNSRAGIALVLIAVLWTFFDSFKAVSAKWFGVGTIAIAGLFYYVSSSPTFDLVYERFYDVSDDGRWDFLVSSLPLIKDYFVFGSGYGSFSALYMSRENLEALSPVYTNHMHSDYLQLLMEGGLLAAAAIGLLIYSSVRGWQAGSSDKHLKNLVRLGLPVIILFALHSVVDYPLRRPAALVYFIVGLTCLFRPLLIGRVSKEPQSGALVQTP